MHNHTPAEAAPPPPPSPPPASLDNHSSYDHHHHGQHRHDDISPPPDYPPPSYDDATGSATAPLLAGAPPGYGTTFPDQSSIATSEVVDNDMAFPEGLGQVFVVCMFFGIIYGFWRIVNAPDGPGGFPG